ncbi:hypothetical protein PSBY109024_10060 [Pseudoalteromonas byunsanensis]
MKRVLELEKLVFEVTYKFIVEIILNIQKIIKTTRYGSKKLVTQKEKSKT